MILRIFKANYSVQIILILIFGILLWLPALFHLQPMPEKQGFQPFYEIVLNVFGQTKLLAWILALFFLLGQSFFLNHVFSKNNLQNRTTQFVAFLYLTAMSSNLSTLTLSPVLFANFGLILSFDKIFEYVNNPTNSGKIYLASLYIGLASFFFLPCIIFNAFIIITLIIFKVYKWREWFISLLGLLAPLLALFTYFFLCDTLVPNLNEIGFELSHPMSFAIKDFSIIDIVYLAFVVLLYMAAFYTLFKNISGKEIAFRYKSYLFIFYIFICFIPFFYEGFSPSGGLYFAIPSAFLFSFFFFNAKLKPILCELFLFLFIILTFLKVLLDSL